MTCAMTLGQANLSSYVPPITGIWWPRAVLCQGTLTFGEPLGQADLQSDIPPIEASGGQEWYEVRSG